MDTQVIWAYLSTQGIDLATKAVAALAVWFIGRWLIRLVRRLFQAALARGRHVDETLARYLSAAASFALHVLLVLAIFDVFGVRTTSFAALLAGAGLAIGTAWGGLLTHFAAGAFLQALRPYKVGDHVIIAGVTGRVTELGLFGTTLVTEDNITALVGNNKVLSDTIQNFSSLPVRRVETSCKLPNGAHIEEAIGKLRVALEKIPHVAQTPKVEIEILQLTPDGPQLAVRAYTHDDNYWQVYFDAQRAILEILAANNPPPSA